MVAASVPPTVIVGGTVNHPDVGASGVSVTVGEAGGGGTGAKPGPLLEAVPTLPAPSTAWITTRICPLSIDAGTARVPPNIPAAGARSVACQSPPA